MCSRYLHEIANFFYRFSSSVYQQGGEYPWSGFKEIDRGVNADIMVTSYYIPFTTLWLWPRAKSLTEMWKWVFSLFTTLSTHMCVCLYWLVLELTKVIKISHCNRPKITLKRCLPRLEKNAEKKNT